MSESTPRRRRWPAVIAAVVVLTAVAGILARPWSHPGVRRALLGGGRTVATPDSACARCHAGIVRSFARHAMGRSLAPIDQAPEPAPGDARFQAGGLSYSVVHRGDMVYHREALLDPEGRELAVIEEPVRYALGSGTRGVSYLIERGDGFLFQSPISWYDQKQRWDLAPGYDHGNPHFEREILPECLTCHSNGAVAIAGPSNQYKQPVFFRGHAISCERCHGPGDEHVRAKGDPRPDGSPSIVNPALLATELREAVCEQCHLMGEVRVERAGKSLADFRPGRPLDEVLSVFVKPGAGRDRDKSIGHVEQMHASRCYQQSEGRLGCISCHDPHEEPDPAARVEYYRERCLACHGEANPCALPEPERTARQKDDSCTACHMPRSALSDIAHTAATRHDIAREPLPQVNAPVSPAEEGPALVAFHPSGAEDRARERAIALATKAREQSDRDLAGRMAREALPLLESSLQQQPDDPPSWEARASALFALGRMPEALEALRGSLRYQPDRETTLDVASMLATRLRRGDEAATLTERLVEVNPWQSDYHARLAVLHASAGRWGPAVEAARAALRLNPASPARQVLVIHYDRTKQPDRARAEREILRAYMVGR
jgi:predicted CXXCH cytochrome family protein